MSWSIAKRAIDFLMAHSKAEKKVNINFYGGEPIINFSLIRQCVDYIEEYYFDRIYQFNMTTNLSLLDDEKLEFFVLHNFKLLVSLN